MGTPLKIILVIKNSYRKPLYAKDNSNFTQKCATSFIPQTDACKYQSGKYTVDMSKGVDMHDADFQSNPFSPMMS